MRFKTRRFTRLATMAIAAMPLHADDTAPTKQDGAAVEKVPARALARRVSDACPGGGMNTSRRSEHPRNVGTPAASRVCSLPSFALAQSGIRITAVCAGRNQATGNGPR